MPPIANAGLNQIFDPTKTNSSQVILDGSDSRDADGGNLTSFSWTQVNGPPVILEGADTSKATFVAPKVSKDTTLTFRLTVTDNDNATSSAITSVLLKHANTPPVVVITPGNQTIEITGGNTFEVTLDGASTTDDGNITSYRWTQISGPTVSLTGADTANPSFIIPQVSRDTTLTFRLTVTDNDNATSSAITNVLVKHVNTPPLADAGTNQTVNENTTNVILDGSKSIDRDGTIKLYVWKQINNNGADPTVVLVNANTSKASFTAPSVKKDTKLTFLLTVTDNDNATSTASTSVLVMNVNIPPVANAGKDQTVNEGATNVKLDGTGSHDPDGTISKYSWTQTAGPTVTLSNASNPTPTFTAPQVNANTTLTFALTVTDNDRATSSNTATANVKVKHVVVNVNHPPIANAGPSQNINRVVTVTLDGSKSNDPDAGDKITAYQWAQIAGPTVTLTGANTANPTFTSPSVNKNTTLTFSLVVTDSKGAISTNPATVNIFVNKAIPGAGTSLTLDPVANVPWNAKIALTGKLATTGTSKVGIGGKTLTFTGTGVGSSLGSITTRTDGTFNVTSVAPNTVGTGWTVQAHFAGDPSYKLSDSAIRKYNTLKHSVSLTVQSPSGSSSSVLWGMPITFTATLADVSNGAPIPIAGELIAFTGSGIVATTPSSTTDNTGHAILSTVSPSTVKTGLVYQAKFAGDSLYNAQNSATGKFDTTAHATSLTVSISPTSVAPSGKFAVSGKLMDTSTTPAPTPLSKMTIKFTVTSPLKIGSITTDSSGSYSQANLAAT